MRRSAELTDCPSGEIDQRKGIADATSPRDGFRTIGLTASRKIWLLAGLCVIVAAGIFLRLPPTLFLGNGAPFQSFATIHPNPKFDGVGYDENLYRAYVSDLARYGPTSYPEFAERYLLIQTDLPGAILPPTRFLYIFSAYLWSLVWGSDSLSSLHAVSSVFSVLLLVLSVLFAWRLGGRVMAIGVAALMAVAPTQIHMSQHALIDGVFAFWATLSLWLLWENLRRPNHWRWLTAYGTALALMVLTKENAMFAYLGLLALLAANHRLRFGTITRSLLGFTVVGPLAGVVALVFLCGGADTFVQIYRLLVSKASVLPYAVATGDGPWYRYLVDLLLVSPIIFLLAWGAIFNLRLTQKAPIFLVVFVIGSYLVMCNVRYGMNLRYANMWDMPMRYLAVLSVRNLAHAFPWRREFIFGGMIALLCAFDLRQYHILFVDHGLYELVTSGLLHALKILK